MAKPQNKIDDWPIEIYHELKKSRFYGKLVLQFENGKVTLIRKEDTLKPPLNNLSEQPGR